MTLKTLATLGLAVSTLLVSGCTETSSDTPQTEADTPAAQTLTVYSSRHYDSDKTLYAMFEEATGTKIDVREAKADQLLETLKAEGDKSPADVIIAADAGSLWRFQDAGLTQTSDNEALKTLVTENFRQQNGHWVGVAKRIRGIAYDPARWSAADVATWDALTSEDKRGEICVRSSSNIYNLSLMAEQINRTGSEAAGAWAKAIVTNMARNPQGGDTDQIRAVAAGECSIAIVNHYYWVRLGASAKDADQAAAASTQFLIPEFEDGAGAHVNITGAAITATADDAGLAEQFIEFLLSEDGQTYLTVETKELPIVEGMSLPAGVEALPAYTPSETNLEVFGQNQAEAQRLFDLAGWN